MESEAITLETSGGAVLTNCIIAAYAASDIEDLKTALISNLKVTNTYSPNSNNSKIYKDQYKLQKDMLKKLAAST